MPRRTRLPEARLELAPLIDVVFVLLAFFILALVVTTRLELSEILLPEARAGERGPGAPSRTLIVSLTSEGEIRVNEQPVTLAEVGGAVDRAFTDAPEAELIVAPDRDSPSGLLLSLLDELGASGYPDLRILRQTPETGADRP